MHARPRTPACADVRRHSAARLPPKRASSAPVNPPVQNGPISKHPRAWPRRASPVASEIAAVVLVLSPTCPKFCSFLFLEVQGHLAKGQRMLAGDGMSQVTKNLLDLTQRRNFYAGDLLSSVEILRNVTETFKRASYEPSSDDVQASARNPSRSVAAERRARARTPKPAALGYREISSTS